MTQETEVSNFLMWLEPRAREDIVSRHQMINSSPSSPFLLLVCSARRYASCSWIRIFPFSCSVQIPQQHKNILFDLSMDWS